MLAAARVLSGLDQRQLAKAAGLNPVTIHRLEHAGAEIPTGSIHSVNAVLTALAKHGVEVTDDSVKLTKRRR
jgi:transcriptional regulator with XRE-family HTH domain